MTSLSVCFRNVLIGNFGKVWRGQLEGYTKDVAVKVLQGATPEKMNELRDEIIVMANTIMAKPHDNIIRCVSLFHKEELTL
jgi:serine/threonine protein kinase